MRPLVLLILDGWGINRPWRGNAISQAATPNFTRLSEQYPCFSVQASGIAVGMPWGEAGNSEVGHLTLGAGRVIMQHLSRIVETIFDGSFFENRALKAAARALGEQKGRLHLAGLVSTGTVHAYIDHLYALLEFAKREGIHEVFLHVFTDGMDSPPREARLMLAQLSARLQKSGLGKIASITGRAFAMNRSGDWVMTQKAYEAILGSAQLRAATLEDALRFAQAQSRDDANFPPVVLTNASGEPLGALKSGDALIFFNFREDSMRQIAEAFFQKDFARFPRPELPALSAAVTLTRYDASLPAAVAFGPPVVPQTLGEVVSAAGKTQLRIAEKEKFAHVTFFFNAWRNTPFPGETHEIADSGHSEETSALGAPRVGAALLRALKAGQHELIVANLADADILAHTGDMRRTLHAVEVIDEALGRIVKAVEAKGGAVLVTADHGHAEEMINPFTHEILTEHTAYPVPLIVCQSGLKRKKRPVDWAKKMGRVDGILADVAPLILRFLGLTQPPEMTGKILVDVSRL